MYNQNSDLMKQEKFMLPTMIEGDFSAEELEAISAPRNWLRTPMVCR